MAKGKAYCGHCLNPARGEGHPQLAKGQPGQPRGDKRKTQRYRG